MTHMWDSCHVGNKTTHKVLNGLDVISLAPRKIQYGDHRKVSWACRLYPPFISFRCIESLLFVVIVNLI